MKREEIEVLAPLNLRRHCRICDRAEPNHEAGCPLASDHPGAALLSELKAARAVVDAARCVVTHRNRNECLRIDNALDDYDAALKARTE